MKIVDPDVCFTLNVPHIGEITANCKTFSYIAHLLLAEYEQYSCEGFCALRQRPLDSSKFIFSELRERGFFD